MGKTVFLPKISIFGVENGHNMQRLKTDLR